jgi:hypothetical protein
MTIASVLSTNSNFKRTGDLLCEFSSCLQLPASCLLLGFMLTRDI